MLPFVGVVETSLRKQGQLAILGRVLFLRCFLPDPLFAGPHGQEETSLTLFALGSLQTLESTHPGESASNSSQPGWGRGRTTLQ